MSDYTPHAWFWIVADGPAGQVWSSATGGYVDAAGANPEAATRIVSEAELTDVLRPYGLRLPKPTADDVRAEAQRRIIALTGASSLNGCMVKQLNALLRATELAAKDSATWSPAEAAEAAALQAMADTVKAIRAASNVLEPAPPVDYYADSHWPS